MPIKSLWTFLFLFCNTVVFFSSVKSQERYAIAYHFEKDTIAISGNQTFSNKLYLTNQTTESVELVPFSGNTVVLEGMIRLPKKIILAPNETRSFPLKYIADRRTILNENQIFTIGFSSVDSTLVIPPARSFYTTLKGEQSLVLQTEQQEYYLDQNSSHVQFILRASNIGLVPLNVRLLFSGFPQGFEIIGESQSINIPAGGQVLLPFTGEMRSKNEFADFDLNIQALDANGRMYTMTFVRILRLGNVKRFGLLDLQNQPYRNKAGVNYINTGSDMSIYQFHGSGNMDFGKNRSLEYSLAADYYQQLRQWNSYNTYIDYQDKDWGIKLGNIYENLDQNINGRGIKASYKLTNDRTISLYGLENNYMLFSQQGNMIPGAKIIGARYKTQAEQLRGSDFIYLHSRSDYRGIGSEQFSGKTMLAIGADHELGLEAGYSLEQAYVGGSRHAAAAGVNYSFRLKGYQLSTNNYYSSSYYTGMRRGLFQSDTRLSRLLGVKDNISIRISYLNTNPSYQQGDRNNYFSQQNRIETYELGYQTRWGNLQLDLRPYFMAQHIGDRGLGIVGLTDVNGSSKAFRASLDLNFLRFKHRFFVRTDYGYVFKNTSERPLAPFHSLRMMGNYSNNIFGFTTFLQINPYYLTDLRLTGVSAKYRSYSFGPNTQFALFNEGLRVQFSSVYSYYGFSRSNNFAMNGNARWQLDKGWSLTADMFYTLMKDRISSDPTEIVMNNSIVTADYRQFRVGLEKAFGRQGKQKRYKLQLLLFEDGNNNGKMDMDELTPKDLVVRIDKEVAITDEKGEVKFLDMLAGNYIIQIENSKGWVAQGTISTVLKKNQVLQIPLIKTGALRGKITVVQDRYVDVNPQLAGIAIYAVNGQGQTYKTLCNEDGSYAFYLPQDKYRVFIPTEGLPFTIENSTHEIELQDCSTIILPDFKYKNERRKVDIKRF